MTYLSGAEKNQVRALLRKNLKSDKLEARRTYHDYYDSCHAPTETPNAPWQRAVENQGPGFVNPEWYLIRLSEFKAGGPLIRKIDESHYELSTGYHTFEVRIREVGDI